MNVSSRSLAIFTVGLVPVALLYFFLFTPWGAIEGITFGMVVFAWGLALFSVRHLPGGKHVGAIGYLTLFPVWGFAVIAIPLSLILAALNRLVRVPEGLALVLYALLLVAFFLVHSTLTAANAHSAENDEAERKAVRALKDAAFALGELEAKAPAEIRSDLRRLKNAIVAAPADTTGAAAAEDLEFAELTLRMAENPSDAGALRPLCERAQAILKRRAFAIQNAAR